MSNRPEKSKKIQLNNRKVRKVKKISTRLSLIISIGMTLLVLILITAGVIAALTLSFNIYYKKTDQTANLCSGMINGDFIEKLRKDLSSPSFDHVRSMPTGTEREEAARRWLDFNNYTDGITQLAMVLEHTKDTMGAEFIYISYIKGNVSMDLVDSENLLGALGYESVLMDEFRTNGVNSNAKVSPIITNGSYGWLSTGGYPIYNSDGKPVAVVFVDISVMDIVSSIAIFVVVEIILSAVFVVLIILFVIKYVKRRVASPLEELTEEVDRFANSDEYDKNSIKELNINTGDEIELLYQSTNKMQRNIIEYMENLTRVTSEKERIGAELNVATQIQADMLPRIFPPFPERCDFDLYASMNPAKEVGGDFYDFFMIDGKHLVLVMADVSGKGVPAALFMVIAKTLIKNKAYMGGSPSEILAYANEQLCEGNDAELFVTVWMAVIDLETGDGIAVNAGHEHPVLRRAGGNYEFVIYKHSPAVAVMEGMKFREHEFHLNPGDSIFVYTDGVPESTNSNDELMGSERMLAALNKNPDAEPEEVLNNVNQSIDEFVAGAEQFDDTTMMSFIYYGKDGKKEAGTDIEHNKSKKDGEVMELRFAAKKDKLDDVIKFINENVEAMDCPPRVMMQLDVAVEELFVNIASYAYGDGEGDAIIRVEPQDEPKGVIVSFIDSGSPYDPLKKKDPDVTLSAEKRQIGGLGIFMVKKSMDDMFYEYKDGQNHLTIVKHF